MTKKKIIYIILTFVLFVTAGALVAYAYSLYDKTKTENTAKENIQYIYHHQTDMRDELFKRFDEKVEKDMERFFSSDWTGFSLLNEMDKEFKRFALMGGQFESMMNEMHHNIISRPKAHIRSTEFIIENTDKEFKASALMQNVTAEMLDISVNNGFLVIKIDKKISKEEKENAMLSSRTIVRRTLSLPRDVDLNKTEVTFKDGLLTITIGKLEQKQPTTKQLKIN